MLLPGQNVESGNISNEESHVISKLSTEASALYLGYYNQKAYDEKHEPKHEATRDWNWGVKARDK